MPWHPETPHRVTLRTGKDPIQYEWMTGRVIRDGGQSTTLPYVASILLNLLTMTPREPWQIQRLYATMNPGEPESTFTTQRDYVRSLVWRLRKSLKEIDPDLSDVVETALPRNTGYRFVPAADPRV